MAIVLPAKSHYCWQAVALEAEMKPHEHRHEILSVACDCSHFLSMRQGGSVRNFGRVKEWIRRSSARMG